MIPRDRFLCRAALFRAIALHAKKGQDRRAKSQKVPFDPIHGSQILIEIVLSTIYRLIVTQGSIF